MKRLASKARVLAFALPVVLAACGGHVDDATPTTTYSIGGTIAGLGSNGLVLANGTDSTSPATGALGFTFGQTVAGGSSYAVTVLTQPANATCSVSQGAGTVGAAAVTTVQVTCAANAYRVGGTISGLASAGLVLANGADTVAPSTGASSFTFANAVNEGSSYAAKVQTQPAGTICSVGNGSGTMGAADVTNVQVTCSPSAYSVGGTITGLDGRRPRSRQWRGHDQPGGQRHELHVPRRGRLRRHLQRGRTAATYRTQLHRGWCIPRDDGRRRCHERPGHVFAPHRIHVDRGHRDLQLRQSLRRRHRYHCQRAKQRHDARFGRQPLRRLRKRRRGAQDHAGRRGDHDRGPLPERRQRRRHGRHGSFPRPLRRRCRRVRQPLRHGIQRPTQGHARRCRDHRGR